MKLQNFSVSLSILGLLMSGCGQISPELTPDVAVVAEPSSTQAATEATTATDEAPALVPTDTQKAQVDLSAWGVSDVAKYSPDGALLAIASAYKIYLYDSVTLDKIIDISDEFRILDFGFSPDNSILSLAYYNEVTANAMGVQQLDVSTGAEISNSVVLDLGDDYSDVPDVWSVSPDGNTFALTDRSTQSENGPIVVRMWDVASGQELHSFSEGYAECLAFSPDSTMLVVCDLLENRNGPTLWDVSSGTKIRSYDVLNSHNYINSLKAAFSIDGEVLVVAATYDYVLDDSYTVMLLDLGTGDELLSFDVPVEPSMAGNPVFAMAYSNDGTMLATGSTRGIKIWDAATGNELQSIDMAVINNQYYSYALTFSPDDTALISASEDLQQVIMWDVATGEQLAP